MLHLRRTCVRLIGSAAPACRAASAARGVATVEHVGLTAETMNEHVRSAQYAVRGELVTSALRHAKALQHGEKRPFSKIVWCNIGNPHELGQKPITFFRQVFALVNYPDLMRDPRVLDHFPSDVVARARRYVGMIAGGTGAYTNSQGIEGIREEVAAFLHRRDGAACPAHAADIFLTDGASPAVQMMIRAMLRHDELDALMIPIPQYPLYSASLQLYGGCAVGYYLNEAKGWSLDPAELRRAHAAATAAGKHVRAIAVINPGNPTGSCLSVPQIRDVLTFAAEKGLMVLADEVYQDNVWAPPPPGGGSAWTSFKRVAVEMGLVDPANTSRNAGVQMASFHSTSKGFTGECGRRGGFMELAGFGPGVRAELYKLASISLCANTGGQLMVGLMTNPPRPGDASYALYTAERDGILASLRRRAVKLVAGCNAMAGVTCQSPEGALYAFPAITLPPAAVAAAAALGKAADVMYCLQLLEETGVVVVPGSGFGQRDGSFHFRSTILPSEEDLGGVIAALQGFHARFLARYSA